MWSINVSNPLLKIENYIPTLLTELTDGGIIMCEGVRWDGVIPDGVIWPIGVTYSNTEIVLRRVDIGAMRYVLPLCLVYTKNLH